MKMKKLLLFTILLNMGVSCIAGETSVNAQGKKTVSDTNIPMEIIKPSLFTQDRKLSFSSGYLNSANSNRAIGGFMNEIMDVYGLAYEAIDRSLGIEPGFAAHFYDALLALPSVVLGWQINVTYHELGHFSRVKSYGGKPQFNDSNNNKYDSFFPFFAGHFSTIFTNKSGVAASVSYNTSFNSLQERFMVSAAGLNNQLTLTESMSEKAYLSGIHPSSFGSYLIAKLSTWGYMWMDRDKKIDFDNPENMDPAIATDDDIRGNDIIHMLQDYKIMGKSIKAADLKYASLLSFFTSGSVYSYLWSMYELKSDRSYKMKPFELFGVRVPDTSAYFMPQGIAYKVSSGYRWSETLVFPVAFEFVTKGDTAYEATMGVYKEFPQWNRSSVRADVIISDQGEMGGKVYIEYSPFDYTYIGFGVESYNPKTLHGARNTPKNEARSNEFWVQVGLKY
jgi:hypothetical protein